jgi:hypothetical protein
MPRLFIVVREDDVRIIVSEKYWKSIYTHIYNLSQRKEESFEIT